MSIDTRCTVADLPSPPFGRTGWPWTEDSGLAPARMPNGAPWPRISVVTPSYNQGAFLEETIRSVLLQGYPNLEYVVIDGGSSDESRSIIRQYESWITYWVSEPDHGQAHAINKGLARCSGELFNWINSDDLLTPGTLQAVAEAHVGVGAIAGTCTNFEENGREELITNAFLRADQMIAGHPGVSFQQPAIWLRRENIPACGGIDEQFHHAFDWDLTIRYLAHFPIVRYIDRPLARFRLHPRSKTMSAQESFASDRRMIRLNTARDATLPERVRRAASRHVRTEEWWSRISALQRDETLGRWRRRMRILSAVHEDPSVRLSRFTLGAIRRG